MHLVSTLYKKSTMLMLHTVVVSSSSKKFLMLGIWIVAILLLSLGSQGISHAEEQQFPMSEHDESSGDLNSSTRKKLNLKRLWQNKMGETDSSHFSDDSNTVYNTMENEEDLSTLLDAFGEVGKDLITHNMIPPTDSQCRWDWRYFRCEPYCLCAFQLRGGDYHLGRSCRLRSTAKSGEEKYDPVEQCQLPPDTFYTKAFNSSRTTLQHGKVRWNVIQLHLVRMAHVVQFKARDNFCERNSTDKQSSPLLSPHGNVTDTNSVIFSFVNKIRNLICSSVLVYGATDWSLISGNENEKKNTLTTNTILEEKE